MLVDLMQRHVTQCTRRLLAQLAPVALRTARDEDRDDACPHELLTPIWVRVRARVRVRVEVRVGARVGVRVRVRFRVRSTSSRVAG